LLRGGWGNCPYKPLLATPTNPDGSSGCQIILPIDKLKLISKAEVIEG